MSDDKVPARTRCSTGDLCDACKGATSKFLALKAAGFTSGDIIKAYKEGKLAELLALVEE